VRRPSLWRLVPLVPSIGLFAVLLRTPADQIGDLMTPLFLVAVVAGAVAVALCAPLVSYVAARGLVASGRTDLRLAGRGIQSQAAPIARRVVALGLAVFVVVGGAGLLSIYEGTTYLKAAIHQVEVGPQEIHVSTDRTVPAGLAADIAAVPGVRAVVPGYPLSPTTCTDAGPATCPMVFVGTCADLAALMVTTGCRDDQPAWIGTSADDLPEGMVLLADEVDELDMAGPDGTVHTVALTGTITQDVRATEERWVWPGADQVFLPAALAQEWGVEATHLTVVADVGPAVRDEVSDLAAAAGTYADATALYDYEQVSATRTAAWTVMAVAVGVALLAYALATVDRARETRRPRARLVALGIPVALLRRVQGVQNLVPLLTTVVLAVGLGLAATAVLAHTAERPFAISPGLLATLLGLVLAGAVLVSCATLPLTRSRIRASDLRDD
jgi:hypothetical protein